MSLNILLMGPQGAGKGTIAALLEKTLHIPHISMGDLLRETTKSDSPLGKEIKSFINKGELVPLSIISEMLTNRLSASDCKQGFLLDGFPRDKEQATILEAITPIDFVIVLDVSEEISLQRLGSRIQCRDCGTIYNLETKPPKVGSMCDICSGELYQREDDRGEAILKRLTIYREETKPLIAEYQSKVIYFDTSHADPQDILIEILKQLKNKG